MIGITPLEAWIREKAHIGRDLTGRFFVEALKVYQLQRVNEIIDYARRNTSFYRRHLASLPAAPLSALSDIARIPFTTPSDLADNPSSFLAVRQDDIARIVTLPHVGEHRGGKATLFHRRGSGINRRLLSSRHVDPCATGAESSGSPSR